VTGSRQRRIGVEGARVGKKERGEPQAAPQLKLFGGGGGVRGRPRVKIEKKEETNRKKLEKKTAQKKTRTFNKKGVHGDWGKNHFQNFHPRNSMLN